MNLMQEYINQQPSVLQSILVNRQQIIGKFIERFRNLNIERVVIIGSGSSYNAGVMARPFIESAMGIEVTVIFPTRIDDLKYMASNRVLYCVLSQGGRSTNTLRVVNYLQINNKPLIAVTEAENSPIGEQTGLTLTIPIGEENIGAKTKGVTATAMVLILAFLELSFIRSSINEAHYHRTINAVKHITENMEENIRRSLAWCNTIKPMLREINCINVITNGNSTGAALEGALKLLETIWKPVACFEFEEYLHGPENALDEKTYGLLLIPNDEDAQRMVRLTAYVEQLGSHYLMIDLKDNPKESKHLSLLGCNNSYLSCFEYLIPLQSLSAQLSEYLGIDITKPRFPDFSTFMGTKLP